MYLKQTFALIFTFIISFQSALAEESVKVKISTNHGDMTAILFTDKAPLSVKNFLEYAGEGFYNNTIFHRVIPNFMIQGGGFDQSLNKKATKAPIKNEAGNKLHNTRGTLAMARTNDPHSATSQFFINIVDNNYLDQNSRSFGYAVFGKVTEGLEIVDKIAGVKTTTRNYMQNVPVEAVVIHSITKVE